METITIIEDRREARVIQPGVRQGQTYPVVAEGVDWFRIRMGGKSVYLDKNLTTDYEEPEEQEKPRKGKRSDR